MDKNNILKFETDDTSKTGINGKQVFFAKRINGKVTRNKEIEKESKNIPEKKQDDEDELFIEFKNIKVNNQNVPQKKSTPKNNINKKNINKNNIPKKKKNKGKKIKSKIFILILLIIGIGIFALVSPIFNIDEIKVLRNEKVDAETIESLSGIEKGKNIFQISKKNIVNDIKENSYINSVQVKRRLPGTIELDIEERKVAYQVKVINSYVYIDYKGYILEVSSKQEKVPLVEGFTTDQDTLLNGKRLINNDIEKIRTILTIIETSKAIEINDLISKITIQNNEFVLELKKENKIIYLGEANDLTNKMTFVKTMLEKEKGNTGKIFVNGDINKGFKPYFREEKINF